MGPDSSIEISPPDGKAPYAIIRPTGVNLQPGDVDPATVISLFRHYGVILFRGFELNRQSFRKLAAGFCTNFILNTARGRKDVSKDGRIRTVNLGNVAFPLHAELSMMPTRPDIAWFACELPPIIKGETLLCDGIAIASGLQQQTCDLLSHRSFMYKIKTTQEECEHWLGVSDPDPAILEKLKGKTPLSFSIEDGDYYSTFITPALHKPMFSDELAFGSFLLFARKMQGWKNFPTFEDGTEVPDAIHDELKEVSDNLTVAHVWDRNDILMVDNTRFMHGRNEVVDPALRSIWTQFGYASFIPGIDKLLDGQPWRRGENQ